MKRRRRRRRKRRRRNSDSHSDSNDNNNNNKKKTKKKEGEEEAEDRTLSALHSCCPLNPDPTATLEITSSVAFEQYLPFTVADLVHPVVVNDQLVND